MHYGDLTDSTNIIKIIQKIKPDEIYNLGAQSHVSVSFESPEYTANSDALGTLRILEAVRLLGLHEKTKIYQASTSELYGLVQEIPQKESTPFYPRSPYAVAKLYAYWITVNYRESYGIFACNGILFNHESPRRGLEFVTRKVTMTVARISSGIDEFLSIGNVKAKRDWGFAGDYVEMQWRMLQQEEPEDFVVATGETHSVQDMIDLAFSRVGFDLTWSGEGVDTIATDQNGVVRVKTNPKFFRPAEVDLLIGDYTLASQKLGWKPSTTFEELVNMMVDSDVKVVKEALENGLQPPVPPA